MDGTVKQSADEGRASVRPFLSSLFRELFFFSLFSADVVPRFEERNEKGSEPVSAALSLLRLAPPLKERDSSSPPSVFILPQ